MSIEVGSKLEGKVTGITHFGAFVELAGGVTGLVHISEIADNYVKDVNDHLKIDDIVTVKVINVDKNGKIGLSIRKAIDKPEQSHSESRSSHSGGRNRSDAFSSSFEDKMSRFLKDSEERISSLRKHNESRRGGRGARRS
jgi:S1 RNA binding domain protein